MTKAPDRQYCNVALLPEDHQKLKVLATHDQRTMTRQLAVIIRKEFDKLEEAGTV